MERLHSHRGEAEVWLQSIRNLSTSRGKLVSTMPWQLLGLGKTQNPLQRRQSGWAQKTLLPLVFNLQTTQPTASSYTNYAHSDKTIKTGNTYKCQSNTTMV